MGEGDLMKKEDVQLIIRVLAPAIKKMVKLEAKRVAKKMIEEAVKNKVNEILAEHFFAEKKRSLVSEVAAPQRRAAIEKPSRHQQEEERAKLREELKHRMGFDESEFSLDNDAFDSIYGDTLNEVHQNLGAGDYTNPMESDDEGVDLSVFGM